MRAKFNKGIQLWQQLTYGGFGHTFFLWFFADKIITNGLPPNLFIPPKVSFDKLPQSPIVANLTTQRQHHHTPTTKSKRRYYWCRQVKPSAGEIVSFVIRFKSTSRNQRTLITTITTKTVSTFWLLPFRTTHPFKGKGRITQSGIQLADIELSSSANQIAEYKDGS